MVAVNEFSWEEVASPTFTDPARQAFRAAVAQVAAQASAKLPECNGRVESAVKLVLASDVQLGPDGTAAVIGSASDAQKSYEVRPGYCSCTDFTHAPQGLCKHRLAAAILRRATSLLTTGEAPDADVEPLSAAPAGPVEPAAAEFHPLPEAPASVNCHVTLGGRQVQVTLRDTDETRLLARLTALLAQYPVEQPQAVIVPTGGTEPGWCALHNVSMRFNTKDGRSWYSHKREDGSWCKGK